MHLAMQKVQMTFFSRKMTFRKEQKNCSFCGESHSSCSQKEQFFVLFWCIWQGKKYKWPSFLERWRSERNKKIALLWWEPFFMLSKGTIFVLFWCIWQGKKYKWRSFLERWRLERNNKIALFVVRAILQSHSSCSQKEQFCCPFLMHLARQKVQMTLFSRKMTFRK